MKHLLLIHFTSFSIIAPTSNDESTGEGATVLRELGGERKDGESIKDVKDSHTPSVKRANSRYWMSRNILLGSWLWDYFKYMGEKGGAEQQNTVAAGHKKAGEDSHSQGWKMRCC